MSKNFTKLTLILLFILITPNILFAQNPPPPFNDDVNDQVDIGTNIIAICILGIAYGFYKTNKYKLNKKSL